MTAHTSAQISQYYASLWVEYYLGIENYLFFSATAVSCYDYLLTLDREIKFIWKAGLSSTTIFFYSYRYPILLNAALEILGRVAWSWQNVESCRVIQWAQMGLDWIVMLSSAIFASLRVYAMYGRRKWLFVVVLLIGLLSPIIWIYVFIRTSPRQNGIDGFWSCTLIVLGPHGSYEDLVMGARAASLLSDGIVLVLTCMKTARRGAMRKMMLGDREPTLEDILLKDTAICFSFLCIINVFALAAGRNPLSIVICTTWIAILSCMLLSRLALDLHEVHAAKADGDTDMLSLTQRSMHEDISSYIDLTPEYPTIP